MEMVSSMVPISAFCWSSGARAPEWTISGALPRLVSKPGAAPESLRSCLEGMFPANSS